MAWVDNTTGTHQGDPLGGIGFAATIQSSLVAAQARLLANGNGAMIKAYYDDIIYIGPVQEIVADFRDHLKPALAGFSLETTAEAWCADPRLGFSEDVINELADAGITVEGVSERADGGFINVVDAGAPQAHGFAFTGLPFGTCEYIEQYLIDTVRAFQPRLDGLLDVKHLQSAQLLLSYCCATRVNFSLRTRPPRLTTKCARRNDDMLIAGFEKLYNLHLDAQQRERIQQSFRNGGYQLRSAVATRKAAFVGAWVNLLVYSDIENHVQPGPALDALRDLQADAKGGDALNAYLYVKPLYQLRAEDAGAGPVDVHVQGEEDYSLRCDTSPLACFVKAWDDMAALQPDEDKRVDGPWTLQPADARATDEETGKAKPVPPPKNLQHVLTQIIERDSFSTLFERSEDLEKLVLRSSTGWTTEGDSPFLRSDGNKPPRSDAGAWKRTCPGIYKIEDAPFLSRVKFDLVYVRKVQVKGPNGNTVAFQQRLAGMQRVHSSHCGCHNSNVLHGYHFTSCSFGSIATTVHDDIVAELLAMARQAGLTATKCDTNEKGKRPDIRIRNAGKNGVDITIDVVIKDPTCHSLTALGLKRTGWAGHDGFLDKAKKHGNRAQFGHLTGGDFHGPTGSRAPQHFPFAQETCGLRDPFGDKVIKHFAYHGAEFGAFEKRYKSRIVNTWRARLSCRLAEGVGIAIYQGAAKMAEREHVDFMRRTRYDAADDATNLLDNLINSGSNP